MREKHWFLKNCALFERLSTAELSQLESHARLRNYPSRGMIYLPADQADAVLLLASGRVKIGSLTADGKESILARMPQDRRAEIKRRFEAALAQLEQRGLGDRLMTAHQIPDEDSRGKLGLEYFRLGIACPFLENESCSIYADRPLACREFLVTSPAENCRNPGPENIVKVPLPAMLSETLYRFSPTGERQPALWFPLVLALRYAAEHADEQEPKTQGVELFQRFLRQAAGSGSRPPK